MIRGKFLTSNDDVSAVMDIRSRVFVDEQGFSPDIEMDEHDKMSIYALVYDPDDRPAGTGRMYLDGDQFMIGRVCVLKSARGLGLGDLVMRMLLYRALEMELPAVYLSAQLPVIDFYRRFGFQPIGETCLDEGVPHQKMRALNAEIDIEGACHKCPKSHRAAEPTDTK